MSSDETKIRRVLETALYADDLEAAKAFYRDVLGLEFHSEIPGRNIFFRCGEGMLLIFRAEETKKPFGAIPSHGTDGAGHVCFSVDPATLEAWKERLVASGVAIESEYQWGTRGKSIYFRDPAGNSLELSHPAIWGLPDA